MDKVIAAYDIDLIFMGERRREVRKLFYDQLDHTNLDKVREIMIQVDIEMNGKKTFQYPEKLKGIVDDIYEKEV